MIFHEATNTLFRFINITSNFLNTKSFTCPWVIRIYSQSCPFVILNLSLSVILWTSKVAAKMLTFDQVSYKRGMTSGYLEWLRKAVLKITLCYAGVIFCYLLGIEWVPCWSPWITKAIRSIHAEATVRISQCLRHPAAGLTWYGRTVTTQIYECNAI